MDLDEEEEEAIVRQPPPPTRRSAADRQTVSAAPAEDDDDDAAVLEEDEDELEYERTHRLVMEAEMLPSGRPAVDKLLAYRLTPSNWKTAAAAASGSSAARASSPYIDLATVNVKTDAGAAVREEMEGAVDSGKAEKASSSGSKKRKAGELLEESSDVAVSLVESSALLSSHLSHQFLCTFKHMSWLHTAWLPLLSLLQEGVKMKIKLSKFLRSEPLLLDEDDDEEELRDELIDADVTCVDKILAVRDGRRRDDIAGVRSFWPEQLLQKEEEAARAHAALQEAEEKAGSASSSSASSSSRYGREYLVKWSSLPYSASTWERPIDFRDSLKIRQFEQHTALPSPAVLQQRLHPVRPPPAAWKKLEDGVEYKGGNQLRPWQVEGVSWLLFNW